MNRVNIILLILATKVAFAEVCTTDNLPLSKVNTDWHKIGYAEVFSDFPAKIAIYRKISHVGWQPAQYVDYKTTSTGIVGLVKDFTNIDIIKIREEVNKNLRKILQNNYLDVAEFITAPVGLKQGSQLQLTKYNKEYFICYIWFYEIQTIDFAFCFIDDKNKTLTPLLTICSLKVNSSSLSKIQQTWKLDCE